MMLRRWRSLDNAPRCPPDHSRHHSPPPTIKEREPTNPLRRYMGVKLGRRSGVKIRCRLTRWYVRAPHPDCKERFAASVTNPARLQPENFAAFEIVLTKLKELLSPPRANGGQPPQHRRMA